MMYTKILTAIILIFCLASVGAAQGNVVKWFSFSPGFGISRSPTTIVPSAVGRVLVGKTAAGNVSVQSGALVIALLQESAVSISALSNPPLSYALRQNFPNPFNPHTTIQFAVPVANDVSIVVYDVLGREVVRLVNQYVQPGLHKVEWNSRDAYGRELPSGIYIVRMVTSDYVDTIKMMIMR
ncbi:MAG: T9SS type A sorting domain-containing protein [Fidelibacterota bacterium]|nr:MAG: T9SS type A sorting domain-containing protein [Candidatus Neomarinimicrobiota bacterium]